MKETITPVSEGMSVPMMKELSKQNDFGLVYKKAIKPHYKEVEKNRASRSAKYRIIEKII